MDDVAFPNFITNMARTISVVNQMLWGDASLDIGWCLIGNIFHSIFGTDVFHRDFQSREFHRQGFHDFFDKDWFPVENVAFRDLGMNAKHHSNLFHFFQNRINILDVGDTKGGISRSTRWIVFACNDGWCAIVVFECICLPDFFRLCVVGEIKCHERLKVCGILSILLQGSKNTTLVFQSQLRGSDRGLEIRHHETATESGVCMLQNRCRCETISTVMVKVVGMGDSDSLIGHCVRFFL